MQNDARGGVFPSYEEFAQLCEDAARIDWLEAMLTPDEPATEVFFAGLRGNGPASAFQCEIAPGRMPDGTEPQWSSWSGATVRAAIDAARKAEQ